MTHAELKAEAKRQGLVWSEVRAMYGELRERELQRRAWKWAIREEAFALSGRGKHFKSTYRKVITGGDQDQIPGFDVLAQELAAIFPELARDGDPASYLWELIREPADNLPPAYETYLEAMDLLADGTYTTEPVVEFDDTPF
jgi:hypothetical protein